MTSNKIIRILLVINSVFVIFIFFRYRTNTWPAGVETTGCLVSFILLTALFAALWIGKGKISNDMQKRNVAMGLCIGLLWTIEIGINNFVHPGLPYRDYIDNTFWGIIELLILAAAARDSFQSGEVMSGIKSGLWTGLASGTVACTSALLLIVFGIKYILSDPLNCKEWIDSKATANTSSMAVYFAYQTFTGAIMHLFLLGIVFSSFPGLLGGVLGRVLRKTVKTRSR